MWPQCTYMQLLLNTLIRFKDEQANASDPLLVPTPHPPQTALGFHIDFRINLTVRCPAAAIMMTARMATMWIPGTPERSPAPLSIPCIYQSNPKQEPIALRPGGSCTSSKMAE